MDYLEVENIGISSTRSFLDGKRVSSLPWPSPPVQRSSTSMIITLMDECELSIIRHGGYKLRLIA